MRIDAHHHLWNLEVRDQPWVHGLPELHRSFGPFELRPLLERHAVDATVVVQTLPGPEETPELLALAAGDPHVKAVVGWTSLTDPAIADRLSELRDAPGGAALVGIRHGIQDEPAPDWTSRPDVRRGLRALAAAGLCYDLLVRPDQLADAVRTVRELPDVRFVLDHSGNPVIDEDGLAAWTAEIRELAACPNVAVKLSGLLTRTPAGDGPAHALRPYADVLWSTVGPDRVMFGSDWPVCLLTAGYDTVVAVADALCEDLSDPERVAVFGATAARWYGIPA
ncbi:amidohydrolase family protein [Streptomyces sp. NBC_01498]|uniref:amidohydrolase family protein n=1 Tax=Streptomyces sp. NBC_01498 TaxID=2975870 RepID=UPI002E7C46CA|nr:amidohydrolase family protein [Streptomyces sp. NBC_01498]WTL27045.1 amidohydrolase family protein [Streptomyces sp. NBC_01498]